MDEKSFHIEWLGPFCFYCTDIPNLFEQDVARKSGIYLWTVEHGGGYLIHYVGQTSKSFGSRFQQHLGEQCSGVYSIYKPESLREGNQEKWWEGIGWGKEGWKRTGEFIRLLPERSKQIYELYGCYRIFLGPLEAPSRILERIEGALVVDVLRKGETVVKKMQDKNVRYRPRWKSEVPFPVTMSCGHRILGLPGKFLA